MEYELINDIELLEIKFVEYEEHVSQIRCIQEYMELIKDKKTSIDYLIVPERVRTAFIYVHQLVETKENFSVKHICQIHKILGQFEPLRECGMYRHHETWWDEIAVGNYYTPADPRQIESLLRKFADRYLAKGKGENSLEKICEAYLLFELIHPFYEGNGRVGKLVCNWMMISSGYGFLAPYLELRWGNENKEHADAFKSPVTNFVAWTSHTDYLNAFFSRFYLYFVKEINAIIRQILYGVNSAIS